MKKYSSHTIIALSEKFDRELLNILAKEVRFYKKKKNEKFKNIRSSDQILVA